jgi:transposase
MSSYKPARGRTEACSQLACHCLVRCHVHWFVGTKMDTSKNRWRVYELADNSPVATEVLRRIAELYAIEAEVRGRLAEQRQQVRHERSQVILDDLRQYLDARNRQVSAKSKLGEAIRYAFTRWDGLSRFLDDGRIDLDSNTVERSIRPLALNRKNALFAGSDEGGDNWVVIATLIENCKLSGINPHTWLTETLTKLADGHPANAVGELMPWTAVG